MEGLEIYSEERKDKVERIIEPPDNLTDTIPGEIQPQQSNRFGILWLLVIIAPLFLITLWQGFQLHGIKISLAELTGYVRSVETDYQHSMAGLRSIEKSLTEVQSSINDLVELSSNQGKTVRNLAKDIGDMKSRLNTLNNLVKERENNEDKEGNNK